MTNKWNVNNIPDLHPRIAAKYREIEFSMPSDLYIGSLLKTLRASKPNAKLLELGMGIGLSLSWMMDGMENPENRGEINLAKFNRSTGVIAATKK